jgi:hypothetical protein
VNTQQKRFSSLLLLHSAALFFAVYFRPHKELPHMYIFNFFIYIFACLLDVLRIFMITWLAEDIEGLLSAEEIQEFFSHPVRMNAGFQYYKKFIKIFILYNFL